MIIINLKSYRQGIGKNSREIVETCEEVSEETGKDIAVCAQNTDLLRFKNSSIEIFSQHIESVELGSHTGHTPVEVVEEAKADGVLINHSEKRLTSKEIKKIVEKTKKHNLTSVICAQSPEECEKFSKFKPDYIAYEDPELIGGNTSISEAEPEMIEKAVSASQVPVLTGAGIHNTKDVEKSIKHGCKGVLVASAVVKSEKPKEIVKELAEGL